MSEGEIASSIRAFPSLFHPGQNRNPLSLPSQVACSLPQESNRWNAPASVTVLLACCHMLLLLCYFFANRDQRSHHHNVVVGFIADYYHIMHLYIGVTIVTVP